MIVCALWEKYHEMILYIVFGGLATLVDWGSYWLLTDQFHVQYMAANLVAQVAAILFAYVTNRVWVFESKVHGFKGIVMEMAKFGGARVLSLLLNMLVMFVGVDLFSCNDKVIKLIASVFVIVSNYVFSKLFVFRGAKGSGQKEKSSR